MCKKNYYLIMAFLLISILTNAQTFTTIIPAKTIIIQKDTNLYLGNANLGTQLDSNILICGDWTVHLSGQSTHVPRIYLEETAHLVIVDTTFFCFWSDIFMKSNTTYDHNRHQCGQVDSIVKMSNSTLIDTGVAVQHVVPVTNLIFDYSLLPGGTAPCGNVFPSASNHFTDTKANVVIQNPIKNELIIDNKSNMNATFILYDITGRKVLSTKLKQGIHRFSMQHLYQGNYMYQIFENEKIIQNGKLVY